MLYRYQAIPVRACLHCALAPKCRCRNPTGRAHLERRRVGHGVTLKVQQPRELAHACRAPAPISGNVAIRSVLLGGCLHAVASCIPGAAIHEGTMARTQAPTSTAATRKYTDPRSFNTASDRQRCSAHTPTQAVRLPRRGLQRVNEVPNLAVGLLCVLVAVGGRDPAAGIAWLSTTCQWAGKRPSQRALLPSNRYQSPWHVPALDHTPCDGANAS